MLSRSPSYTRRVFCVIFFTSLVPSLIRAEFDTSPDQSDDVSSNSRLWEDYSRFNEPSSRLPKIGAWPIAPSPPESAQTDFTDARGRETSSYRLASPSDVIPAHMKDFHSRVLSYLRTTSETQSMVERSSEYMFTLYRHQMASRPIDDLRADMKVKHVVALRKSDLVRSFEALESFKQATNWVIVFDLSAILSHERIRLSEIQLHVPRHYDDVTSINIFNEQKMTIGKETRLERRKIGSVSFSGRRMPKSRKVIVSVTRTIRRWYNRRTELDEQDIVGNTTGNTTGLATEKTLSSELDIMEGSGEALAQSPPMLFVYSANKHLNLMDTALEHSNRHKRTSRHRISSKHRYDSGARSAKGKYRKVSRKKNKTDKTKFVDVNFYQKTTENSNSIDKLTSNELEYVDQWRPPVVNKSDDNEMDLWRKQQSEVIPPTSNEQQMITQRTRTKSPVQIKPLAFFPFPLFSEPTHCRRVSFEVNFAKVGWNTWIIQPKRFNAYRCEGSCSSPTTSGGKPTNHAFMQSLLSQRAGSTVPEPCCVPTKLKSLSMLYFEGRVVKHREHADMVVVECGCR